ncbi:15-hydroxyprostaglandin dehydrogenase [NAD(+)] [Lingula anatina]|uniref:15-hydroxyprostaglandin dehydrogenase [NAD(+)] n=1 Tax=Lingula anatina TaxID=7574 RepID=A0A1S3IU61_LINAN|nr:15-hydroxyprostaglandin dehydrogenase [NAD(+)] [Lingula anatina]XP_013401742.1 15-hydroxyprostaglandin dehydrogenase [NAD(+)] [Lingula anatina]XP_013401743.1 15-hydroxyprostaglandin dehydrogenase [NAD(+)] [Lingula anatina]|eukprot:XP_013401741.1 15-hydroxyprostaglandin dehydrogenase [NAD(+)] [Lingula anatina]
MDLKDKVAFITGSASGIGLATADLLLKHGSKVALSDIDTKLGAEALNKLMTQYGESNVIFIKCDVTKDEEIEDALKKTKATFGRLDIIMNNAGIVNEKDYKLCISVNVTAVISGTLMGMEYLRKDRGGNGGVVLNVASMAGLKPYHYFPAYAATKHGVVGYTRSIAHSMAPDIANHGVRFNAVCPDFTDTPLVRGLETKKSLEERGVYHMDELSKFIAKNVDDMIRVSTVAENIVKLLADENKNGAIMLIKETGASFLDSPDLPSMINSGANCQP